MKNFLPHTIYISLALLFASPSALLAAPSDETAIKSILSSQADAWNRGDIDGYMDGYARDRATTFVGGDVVTRGWKTVRDRYKKKYDTRTKMGTLRFSEIKVTLIGPDAALVSGGWKLNRATDRPHGRFTLLFRKRAEGWRIVYDHSSTAGN